MTSPGSIHSCTSSRTLMPALVSSPTDRSLVGRSKSAKHLIPTSQNDFDFTKKAHNFPLSQEPDWPRLPKEEPLVREMEAKLRVELRRYHWFFGRDVIYRRETKTIWTSEYSWMFTHKTRTSLPYMLNPHRLKQFCNKPTTLYWAHSAQPSNRCPLLPFGCIYKEWFRCRDDNPNFEIGYFFFANPVRITSDGPTTIPQFLRHTLLFAGKLPRSLIILTVVKPTEIRVIFGQDLRITDSFHSAVLSSSFWTSMGRILLWTTARTAMNFSCWTRFYRSKMSYWS